MYKQHMNESNNNNNDILLHHCLYFTANRLSRAITHMAEEEFRITGITPTYAFLIMVVNSNQGICQKELCEILHLAPSTVTRFIDKLENKGILTRKQEGKKSFVYSTTKGQSLQVEIDKAWKNLHDRYSEVLGLEEGHNITQAVDIASQKLEDLE